MRPINEVHVAEPGLAAVEIAARDDQTAFMCALPPGIEDMAGR
ncbi:DUF6207 family protein [Streptomyces sp. NPDC048251]